MRGGAGSWFGGASRCSTYFRCPSGIWAQRFSPSFLTPELLEAVVRFRTDQRKDFFMKRIAELWNSFPQEAIMATNLYGCKRGLDKLIEKKAVSGY